MRFRIAFAYFFGALIVSGLVAGSTYALAQTFLTRQRTDSVVRQSFNSLRFANEYLARPVEERSLDQLVELLTARGTGDVLLVAGPQRVSSSVSITPDVIPVELTTLVDENGVGHVVFGENPRRFAFGSPMPQTDLDVYFVYSLRDLDETLGLLARILVVVVAGAVGLAGVLGFRLADRTIRPLRTASEASQRVAEGLLETRLEESGRDELGMLAASFNAMTTALQDRISRERRFVADVSHELRTPLTALKTSVGYLAERVDEFPVKYRAALQVAADEVRSLQRLVDDLLELSRVEAGGVHVTSEEIDLGAFATEVVRWRARGKDVRVEAPEGLIARTDKARLERVVGNLLENAIVHGQGRDVRLTVEAGDGEARIVVSDGGPGIDPEHLSRIFERFWRADEARGRGGSSGAGLGLAIARENANVIGAELDVDPDPRTGARFRVHLPLARDVTEAEVTEQ